MKEFRNNSTDKRIKISAAQVVLLTIATVISALLGSLFCGSLVSYAAIALSAACLACLIYATDSFYYLLSLLPVIAVGIFVSNAGVSILVSLVIVAAAVPISLIPNKTKDRTSTLAYAILAMSLMTVAVLLVFLYLKTGSASIKSLKGIYEPYVDVIKVELKEFLTENEFSEEIISTSVGYVDVLIKTIVFHLPSILTITMTVIAYLTTVFFKLCLKLLGIFGDLADTKWEISPSKAASVIYFISYLALILLGSGEDVVSLTASNIMMIFTPAFVVVGVRVMYNWIKTRESKTFKVICYFTAVFSLVFNISMFLTIFATSGAIISFVLRKKAIDIEKNK